MTCRRLSRVGCHTFRQLPGTRSCSLTQGPQNITYSWYELGGKLLSIGAVCPKMWCGVAEVYSMSCLLNQSPCALPLRDKGDPAGKVGGLTSTLSVTRTNQTSKSCCGEFLRCWVTPFTKVHYDLMSSGNQGGKLLTLYSS